MTITRTIRRAILIAAIGVGVAFGIAGCDTGGIAPSQPGDSVVVTAPVLHADSPGVRGASKTTAVNIGTTLNTTTGTVTVYGSQPYVHGDYGMEGPGLLYDVQVTINSDAVLPQTEMTRQAMWSLVDADNHVITPASLYQSNPTLVQFPDNQPIFPGDAVRGWVIFKTPLAPSQLTVRYTLTDGHYFWNGA